MRILVFATFETARSLESAITHAEMSGTFDFDETQKGVAEMYKVFQFLGLKKNCLSQENG
jgi:hypothetical protein